MGDIVRASSLRLTTEQDEAKTAERSMIVVEAGAGTGKTAVLVERFLYILERHPDWPLEGIVAVTFTDKATREMRSRIRQAIEARAVEPDAPPQWREHRRRLDLLQVSTIHGLCARLLRENAIAAGLDPFFVVLDENGSTLMKAQAVDSSLRSLVIDESPALALLDSHRFSDVKEELLALLDKRGLVQRMFDELPGQDDLVAHWRAGAAGMLADIWSEMHATVPQLASLEEIARHAISIDPLDKLVPAVQAARDANALIAEGDLAGAAALIDGINLVGGKAANWGGKDALAALKDDLKVIRTAVREQLLPFLPVDERLDLTAANVLHWWQALWSAASRAYERLKGERASLDFDDLELLAERLLLENPRSDRLRATLAEIRHLMVDEFQDVNERQGRIIASLAPGASTAGLFVVGDAKQSIYRFRQAQVAVFTRISSDVAELTGAGPVKLRHSFRTHRELVEAVNVAFERVLRPIGAGYCEFEAHPSPLVASRDVTGGGAPVEVMLVPAETAGGQKVSSEDGRLWEASWLANRLIDLHATRSPVWDKRTNEYRPLNYGDIAVLFRASTHLPLFEETFSDAGLPYVTVSGGGYYDRPEVADLISLLECLSTPSDDLALAATLRSPMFNLSDDTLYRLRLFDVDQGQFGKPRSLRLALSNAPWTHQPEDVAHASSTIGRLREMTGRVDVWTLLRAALDLTAYETILCKCESPSLRSGAVQRPGRSLANVRKFMALARDAGGASLSEFLGGLRELKAREAREGEAISASREDGAVQLMSIHAAKGLEFPVVAIVDLGRSSDGGASRARILHDPAFGLACKTRDAAGDWQESTGYRWGRWLEARMDVAERKRLLYVAMTRAADLLLLSGRLAAKSQPPEGSWLADLLPAWEIDPGGAEDETVQCPGFRVRVYRPVSPSEADDTRHAPTPAPVTFPMGLPALVRRLPAIDSPAVLAATGVKAHIEGEGPLELARRRHVSFRDARGLDWGERAAAIGRIVHRALDDWDCLERRVQLDALLETWATQECGGDDAAMPLVVRQAHALIGYLRGSPIYERIARAKRRYAEFPFTMRFSGCIIDGTIDAVLQDESGAWSVIEWKTEPPRRGVPTEQVAEEHVMQVTIYAEAVRRLVHAEPRAILCLLARDAAVYEYSRESLDTALSEFQQSLESPHPSD